MDSSRLLLTSPSGRRFDFRPFLMTRTLMNEMVQVEQCQALLKENGVNLTLTVVDTPGFGDAVDNSNW